MLESGSDPESVLSDPKSPTYLTACSLYSLSAFNFNFERSENPASSVLGLG